MLHWNAMTNYDVYVFLLCLIVFTVFVLLFSAMIATIAKMKLKLIRHGLEDEEIKKEYRKNKGKGCRGSILGKLLSLLICAAFLGIFAFSLYMHGTESRAANGIPSIKVVKSDSMAKKHEKNCYLRENGLDDQIQVFDLVVTRHLPPEEELELYDIVVYRQDEMYIIHRIVGIEEPNAEHPGERHFLLQGDAVPSPDIFPVRYSQMQGIYEGERIPFVGSFVLFMQSPAGWLCIILVLYAMIAEPIVERKIRRETVQRLAAMEEEAKRRQAAREEDLEKEISHLAGV